MNQDGGKLGDADGSGARVVYVDRHAWQQLAEAASADEFASAWLSLLATLHTETQLAVVVLGPADTGPFRPVAAWPRDAAVGEGLSMLAERALDEQQGQVERSDDGPVRVAFPLLVDGEVHGVVASQCAARVEPQQHLRHLQWGAAWLETFVRRERARDDGDFNERLMRAVDVLALSLQQPTFAAATLAVVTQLATDLACDRVSLGVIRGRQMRLEAMSHSAQPGQQMNLVRAIEGAMDEALDAKRDLIWPEPEETVAEATMAHRQLAERQFATVLSVPLLQDDTVVGAITLERPADRAFDGATVEFCRSVAALAGPVLHTRRLQDRPLVVKVLHEVRQQLARLFGAGFLGRKLVGLGALLVLAFMIFATGEFRVAADARLEGEVRRVVAAPVAGYVIAAPRRAGDTVEVGETLFLLDDRELQLERLQIENERSRLLRQRQEATAQRERAQVKVLDAQLAQADARAQLVATQIERTKGVAPFDGLLVEGDLSQSLGAAVERGQVLFEIAPLKGYRVVLKVDEHDIRELAVGQTGQIMLTAMPGKPLPFTVRTITPVAEVDEGINFFRVEADLAAAPEELRPGMEGVAKVSIEQRRLIDIWTHRTRNWLRLWLWSWWP